MAVLYPLRTAWMGGPSHEFGRHTAFWTEHLAREGIDYALIDECDLLGSASDGSGLRLPDGRTFPVLVLPGVEAVRSLDTVERLRAFLDAGGVVVSTGVLPSLTQDGGDVRAADELTLLSGWRFRPVTRDVDATCSRQPIMPFDGWQAQGYPTFCGTGEYRIDVEIPDGAVSPDGWEMLLPATEDSVEVLVDGRPAGAAPWPSGAIRLGGLLHAGVNALTVRVTSSAANHYYHGTGLQGDGLARCGLLAPPVLRPVRRWHDIDGLLA
mgnify:CR=1 FL=1